MMIKHLNAVAIEKGRKEFEITPENSGALNSIHKYLCNPSFQQGILLWGPVGNGKTITMEAFSRCMKEAWRKGLVTFNAPFIRTSYYKEVEAERYTTAYKVHLYRQLIINDLGFEKPYSSGEEIIQTILFDRFENDKTTHGTTNMNPAEFIQRYDDDKHRMLDRFKPMFQFIEVKGGSYR